MIPNEDPLLGSSYPKMLYRETKGEPMVEVEGRKLEHCIVADEDEELARLEEGWDASPLPAKPRRAKGEPEPA